jgi:hypothetical protein
MVAGDLRRPEAVMWHAMFAEQIPLAEKILRTVLVYALITVLFPAGRQAVAGHHEHVQLRGHLPAVKRRRLR